LHGWLAVINAIVSHASLQTEPTTDTLTLSRLILL